MGNPLAEVGLKRPPLADSQDSINAAQYGDFCFSSLAMLAYRHDLGEAGGVGFGQIFNCIALSSGTYISAVSWGNDFDDDASADDRICVDATASTCLPCDAPGAVLFNHNLGANQAAYAIWSPKLTAALNSGLYDVMQVDIRMRDLNNGYEQIFIGRMESTPPHEVPTPTALLLMSAGLLMLWRQRKL